MPHTQQIIHPSAWKKADFQSPDDYAFDLNNDHLQAFRNLVERVRESGQPLFELPDAMFAMPEIAADLAAIRHELTDQRGLVLMRGFPVEEMSEEDLTTVFWAIGKALGHAVSQSPQADRIGCVTDVSKPKKVDRAYRTPHRLTFHTDSDEIVGLLCIRQAMTGGYSRLVSSVAVHNVIAARRPDLLEPLYEGFHYHWYDEQPEGMPPNTPYQVPVFACVDGLVSALYIREFIYEAAWHLRRPLTHRQLEALDYLDAVADRRDLVLKFRLKPGEASFINNYTVMHSRTEFADGPDPKKKRLLLRLWLRTTPRRPVHPHMQRFCDDRPGAQL